MPGIYNRIIMQLWCSKYDNRPLDIYCPARPHKEVHSQP